MLLKEQINLDELGILNPLVSDYLSGSAVVERLYSHHPTIKSIPQVIKAKENFSNRKILVEALQSQYEGLKLSSAAQENLDALAKENTFTICTAHQLCLFTGPSYFIYKILSAVKLAKDLQSKYPTYKFVPVYWMGSEDHDFEEISSAMVYGKPITWQNTDKGAIGSHSLKGMEASINELAELLGQQEYAEQLINDLRKFFSGHRSYGQSFQAWILDLFSSYGLIVLDQDDAKLKGSFKAVMKDELLHNSVEHALKKNEAFLNNTYHVQATSRAINLFYLKGDVRTRIERQGESFSLVDSDITFSKEEMLEELSNHPERISPNVFLRPVYQESVLPNVAFVGGPGEVAYWLQLKDVFNHFEVAQPIILLRDMAVVMAKSHLSKLSEWGIPLGELFTHYDEIAKDFVKRESDNELSLKEEQEAIKEVFTKIKAKAVQIDKNMDRSVESEQQKIFNSLSNLESKLIRAEKRTFEQQLKQLENIQSKLLPQNTLQERYDNFLPVYLKNKESYFEDLLASFNPFEQSLKVFEN
ncbi:MAG: bacillithiol biosynthesis cysteine-adding enzyme BshC [Bacteroidia bacterium]|jgi:bacillithiol biosynthesis cysteine-adding enzyme BshC